MRIKTAKPKAAPGATGDQQRAVAAGMQYKAAIDQSRNIHISASWRAAAEKQDTVALRSSDERFNLLIENGLDNISLVSAQGKLLWESPAVLRTLDYPPAEFIGNDLFQLVHPDDLPAVQKEYAALLKIPGSRTRAAFRLRHHDGTWRWVDAIATNLLEEPSVGALVLNYRDISDIKLAEQKLRESEEGFRGLYENASMGIYRTTPEGQILLANPALVKMVGYSSFQELARLNIEQDGVNFGYDRSKFREEIESKGEIQRPGNLMDPSGWHSRIPAGKRARHT